MNAGKARRAPWGPCLLSFALAFGGLEAATYHLDCSEGMDSRAGTSPATAWQSLSKASAAGLLVGDTLRLKRGCAWVGTLRAGWSGSAARPILVGAYGTGELPIIQDGDPANVRIAGHDVVVESLWVRSNPVRKDTGCRDQPVGGRSGFEFVADAYRNTLRGVKTSGHSMGVYMAAGSRGNRVLDSDIFDNVSLTVNDRSNPDNDAGAFGILVNGDSNEIAYNRFSNNLAWCSYDYGIDGSSVEIFNGRGNRIHHNRSEQEGAFTELGGSRTEDNVFAYNLLASDVEDCVFLNVRGASGKWGPNAGTGVFHNTVYLTGAKSQGVVCSEGCSPEILELRNNVLWVGWKAVFVDQQPEASHNIFWKEGGNPLIQNLSLGASNRIANPGFADAAKGDFRSKAGSPAVDAGIRVADSIYGSDLEGRVAPAGSAPDIGAYESGSAAGIARGGGPGKVPTSSRSIPGRGWFFSTPGSGPAILRDAAGRGGRESNYVDSGFPWR